MRNYSKLLIFLLLLSSFPLPILAVNAHLEPAQSEELHFRFASGSEALNWDPAVYDASWGNQYRWATLEGFFTTYSDWNGSLDTVHPMLATDFKFEYWPEQVNSKGFRNRNGVKAVNLTLRENVTFHDGSIFNATVAKWNIDRLFIISGDLTGNGDIKHRDSLWVNVDEIIPFFTPGYNLTWALGKLGSYNGMVAPGLSSPLNPLWNHVPSVNNTQILVPGDPVTGGGVLRIEWNDWNPAPLTNLLTYTSGNYYGMILSMDAYKADYTDAAFIGYGPGSCIGTGPYIFDHHTTSGPTTGGLMLKNENYWNKTHWEEQGLFDVTHIDVVVYSDDTGGRDSRNEAFYNYDIDFVYDIMGWELNYDTVINDPNIVYAQGLDGYQYSKCVTLNCINETYWKDSYDSGTGMWPGLKPPGEDYYGNVGLGGIPRLFRKAISYAFNYTNYINAAFNGRAWRLDYFWHVNSTYNQGNIPIAYTNITIARKAMLEAFPVECAARGLNPTNLDDDVLWRDTVAASDPIFKLNFYWDVGPDNVIMKDEMIKALKLIGCDIWLDYPDDIYPDNEFASSYESLAGGNFPYYLHNGFCGVDWTLYAGDEGRGFVYAYFRNMGDDSFDFGWNFAYAYNDSVDDWFEEGYFSNTTRRQVLYDNIANHLQNYQYPWLWVCQTMTAAVWLTEWDIDSATYDGIGNFIRINYVGGGLVIPPIPGFMVGFMLASSLLAMVGVITVIKRKRKL